LRIRSRERDEEPKSPANIGICAFRLTMKSPGLVEGAAGKRSRPCFPFLLKDETSSNLNLSRTVCRRVDHAELRVRYRHVRGPKHWIIQHIERLKAELEVCPLGHVKLFDHRCVEVVLRVLAQCAKGCRQRTQMKLELLSRRCHKT